MEPLNKTYAGDILSINHEKGFGFIRHKEYPLNLYFKVVESNKTLLVGDKVVFSITALQTGFIANSVRKIYTNNHGILFFARPNQSHLHLSLDNSLSLIFNTIENYDEEFIDEEFILDRKTGVSECVKTSDGDKIVYAIRKGRLGHSRLIMNKQLVDTNSLFLVVKRTEIGYLIITFYAGSRAAREPFDPLATEEDLLFWRKHALVYDETKIITDSLTTIEPWILNKTSISNLK